MVFDSPSRSSLSTGSEPRFPPVRGDHCDGETQTILICAPVPGGTETQGQWSLGNKETYWLMKLRNPG